MAHWIIEDHGFGGQTFRCSECRESWNDIYYTDISMKEFCPNCWSPIYEEREYIEESSHAKLLRVAQSIIKYDTKSLRDYNEMEARLISVSGYDMEKLIELFVNGYTLQPPKYERFAEAMKGE